MTQWAIRTPAPVSRRPLRAFRWILILAVLGGVVGMHVLSAGDTIGGHGSLPATGEEQPAVHSTTEATTGHGMTLAGKAVPTSLISEASIAALVLGDAVTGGAMPGGAGHMAMAMCVLFLVASAASVLAMLLVQLLTRRRRDVLGAGAAALFTARVYGSRRGPPGGVRPHLALCVWRI